MFFSSYLVEEVKINNHCTGIQEDRTQYTGVQLFFPFSSHAADVFTTAYILVLPMFSPCYNCNTTNMACRDIPLVYIVNPY